MKNKLLAGLWVLAFLALPTYAFANNFLANGVVSTTGQTLPGTKVNAPNPPNVPANEQVTATEFNTVTGALNDISSFLLPVTGLVDAGQALATNPAYSLTLDAGFVGNLTVGAFSAGAYPYTSNADPRTTNNGAIYSAQQIGDFDSLVPSYYGDRAWASNPSCNFPPNYQLAAGAPISGSSYIYGIDLNPENLSGGAYESIRFALPPGATAATIGAYMQKGANDTGTTGLGFTNYNCSSNLGGGAFSLTSSMLPYSYTLTKLTPQHDYYAGVWLNGAFGVGSTVSDPVIGPIQVLPTNWDAGAPPPVFAGDFWRIGANAHTLWGNSRDQWLTTNIYAASPRAYMEIETDAVNLAVELENTYTGIATQYAIAVFVNGLPYSTYVATQYNSEAEFASFVLPTGMKAVEIDSSIQAASPTQLLYEGPLLNAIYLPASATTRVHMPPTRRSLAIYGDSICSGLNSPIPIVGSYADIIKRWFPGTVFSQCASGSALGSDIGDAGVSVDGGAGISQSALAALTQYLSWSNPTDIYLATGVNDYQLSGHAGYFSSTPEFGIGYAALLDSLHQRNPNAIIYAQSLLITKEEATPYNGFVPPDYRTQISNACAARASWCTFVDGTTMLSMADISGSDLIHPLAGSHSKLARAVMAALSADPVSSINTLGWLQKSGSCTLSSGTCAAAVPGATGSSLCYCGVQGTYARDAGTMTCYAQADAGSATCYCQTSALAPDPAPAPVGIHCDN